MNRITRLAAGATVAAAIFAGGIVYGQQQSAPKASATTASDYCTYKTETRSFSGGYYTVLSAVVARQGYITNRWESVSDYDAAWAVSSNCRYGY